LSNPTLTGSTFKNKKRGFILPGHPVSQDRLKAACKEHKITITNDYEKADFSSGGIFLYFPGERCPDV
ncbi:MAG: hypothetical protein KAT15_05045, partial [Bacteroidales bacterium]|nr:hypothetical protein [Bacteroidales bacterium]